jgi:hypothetical protein
MSTGTRTFNSTTTVPPARRATVLVTAVGDERIVYDAERHAAHCLNQTAALVWQHCDGTRTVADICSQLERVLGGPVSPDTVWYALDQLDDQLLLEARLARASPGVDAARRAFLRRAGLAAAIAVPVVMSIAVPTSAQAASCRPTGSSCLSNGQCCSGDCSGGVCL